MWRGVLWWLEKYPVEMKNIVNDCPILFVVLLDTIDISSQAAKARKLR